MEVGTCHGACNSVVNRSNEGHACASTVVSADMEPYSHIEYSYITSELADPPSETIDLIGKCESGKEIHSHFNGNDCAGELNYPPMLELSLERSYPSFLKDEGAEDTLNHSKASAFSSKAFNNHGSLNLFGQSGWPEETFPNVQMDFTLMPE
ncbi:unnamed protein product [Fraxinus pennsylvanica]|uniref:Uncharacterized protein n=1 Tax=Fraxinus pennsylvanica TaxID=56036 RepID=A0AAD1ZFF7_9LAMI|nr:unnamed protein product [Fraxinus pennsylvanica]